MELSGNITDYFVVFWGGVLVSFTPCVYPVIPLTASFIGGMNTKGTKLSGFFISLVYVFGLAITYCTLAVVGKLMGLVFGRIQNEGIVFLLLGWAFILFAFMMFDVIRMPVFGVNLQHKIKIKKKNLWVVLLFGMVSGLVVAPCAGPVIGGLLTYVATKKNFIHAVSLMFVFSYGVGASLILVGTFSGLLVRLPKSGPWLVRIKQFCGLILLLFGLYFIYRSGEGLL